MYRRRYGHGSDFEETVIGFLNSKDGGNIYIGVSDISKIPEWDTFSSKIKEWNEVNSQKTRRSRPDKKLHFYDYKTVNVWGH